MYASSRRFRRPLRIFCFPPMAARMTALLPLALPSVEFLGSKG
jgi:hypothetical protein